MLVRDGNHTAKADETILRAALLRRATEDVRRLHFIRTAKGAANMLLEKGSVSVTLWKQVDSAEKGLQKELADVLDEVTLCSSNRYDD